MKRKIKMRMKRKIRMMRTRKSERKLRRGRLPRNIFCFGEVTESLKFTVVEVTVGHVFSI